MRYRILGSFEVADGDRLLDLPAAKHRALLALLLLRANEVVSVDCLIDDLWNGQPPKTAKHVVQVYVSQLRRALGNDAIKTRAPGYELSVEPGELDLYEFERLARDGRQAVEEGRAAEAAELLGRALSTFRGTPLSDFSFDSFAQAPIARLEELRLAALEDRFDADLARGRHAELAAELRALVERFPLRERLRGQLMLALYRSGRQAEALEAYQEARHALVDELGIEPGPSLQTLERSILRQEPELAWTADMARRHTGAAPRATRILVFLQEPDDAGSLLPLLALLARPPASREAIFLRLAADAGELARASGEAQAARAVLREHGIDARATAFTSADEADDVVRLASQQDAELVLLVRKASNGEIDEKVASVFERSPCDVAAVVGGSPVEKARVAAPVLVPFGGLEHDWAALELGAWVAGAGGASLRLLGSQASVKRGGRDASRLLGAAALAVQQLTGVDTEPVLSGPDPQTVVEASKSASLVVFGCSSRWRGEGLGPFRASVAANAACPAVVVHRGPRPGGITPHESLTRFTWSFAGAVHVE